MALEVVGQCLFMSLCALHRRMCNPEILVKSARQSVTCSPTLVQPGCPRALSGHDLLNDLICKFIRVHLQACPKLTDPTPTLLHIGETETRGPGDYAHCLG